MYSCVVSTSAHACSYSVSGLKLHISIAAVLVHRDALIADAGYGGESEPSKSFRKLLSSSTMPYGCSVGHCGLLLLLPPQLSGASMLTNVSKLCKLPSAPPESTYILDSSLKGMSFDCTLAWIPPAQILDSDQLTNSQTKSQLDVL